MLLGEAGIYVLEMTHQFRLSTVDGRAIAC